MRFAANPRPRTGTQQGYALLTTLLVLSLILMVVVALLGLQRRNAGRVALDRDTAEARANAIYALETALGELQRYAGPDQAVTAPADILEEETNPIANPKWTGVWHATEEGRTNESPGIFLVSGNERFEITDDLTEPPEGYLVPEDPLDPASPEVVELVPDSEEGSNDRVVVPVQTIHQPGETTPSGHYAYWVGDEGIKAKVNLLDAHRAPEDDEEKMHRLTVAQRNGMESLFPEYDPEDERLEALTTLDEFALIQEQDIDLAPYFHDLTTYSKGLLTDTRRGGLRRDLTTAFENDKIFQREFGARPTSATSSTVVKENDQYQLDTNRLGDFYLIEEILETAVDYDSDRGRWVGGPNWGNLREFYLLKEKDAEFFPFLPHPRCGVAMREYSFTPYKHGTIKGTGLINQTTKKDYYHRNSPVSPILSRAQVNVRLRTRELPRNGDEEPNYIVDLEIQPVIGIWNPHNIRLSPRRYLFDWEVSVFLKIEVGGREYSYDLYRLWKGSNKWFRLRSTPIDFEPGELRLLSVESRSPLAQEVALRPGWSQDGSFWKRLPKDQTDSSQGDLIVRSDETINITDVALVAVPEDPNWKGVKAEFEKHNTFMAIKYGESINGSTTMQVTDSSTRMNNLWKADDEFGPISIQELGDAIPPFNASQHTAEPKHLAAWSYYLRTTQEDDLGHRNFIDSNVRAIVANSRWDGSVEDRGWRALGWLNDGINRALLPPGNEEPEADGLLRYRGFGGNSIGGTGETHLILFDVPREPLVSLGQLQHANLGRYNNEPSFIIGNSYHNIRIPLEEAIVRKFAEYETNQPYTMGDLDVFDLSWFVNHQLWDSWYFSTVLPDDAATTISEAKSGETPLPNGRFHIHDPEEELALRFAQAENNDDAYNALAAGFTVDGAFNVNSTSVEAWKAVLGSLRNLEIPVHDPLSNSISWEKSDLLFSRFAHPYDGPFRTVGDVDPDLYWRGYREISEEQLTELAEEIVRQVKLRGPFRSLGDFVNRSLEDFDPSGSAEDDTRLSGPLQAALDRTTINRDIPSTLAQPVDAVPDSANEFSDVPEAATQGTGFPGYLLQGDILQALGPILTARSDTFRIRAYGDKVVTSRQDPSLEVVTARAWCEAIVQRLPDPVEKLREDSSPEEDLYQDPESIKTLYHDVDKPYFGRRFRVVSFRWLEKDEL